MVSVCVIGLWHLGCVTAACLAKDHKVTGYDSDSGTVENLEKGRPPIFEPGLEQAIREAAGTGSLSFTSDLSSAAQGADVIYVAIDTPVGEDDQPDVSPIFESIGAAMPFIQNGQLVVVSSQVPVGTCRRLLEKIRSAGKNAELCYAPENLRLGSALEGFMKPDRLVLGVSSQEALGLAEEIFKGVSGERIAMGLESAEMAKHAMNTYLATMISFSSEISDLCEKTGANAIQVMGALRKERRVSPHAPISPGLGFGGGTLARDVQALRQIGREKKIRTPMLDAAMESNSLRMGYVRARLSSALGNLQGRSIAFFGLTYKPGTDTLRRSLALQVIDSLRDSGASFCAYDPAAKSKVESHPHLRVCLSAAEAASGADAIVITTEWEEFRRLDYSSICSSMREQVIVDARNMLSGVSLPSSARYFGVGVSNEA